jgi:KDO2-lipid IV(A) lauroyltransferase
MLWSGRMTSLVLWLMRVLRWLPLPVLRSLGAALGWLLYISVPSRRRVASTNLALCFPHWSEAQRARTVKDHFRVFAQTWLDRSWLWHGTPDLVRRRVRLCGDVSVLKNEQQPVVIFAPHFVGLDVGWTMLALSLERAFTTIYTQQSNEQVDRWVVRGRGRWGRVRLFRREAGVKPIISALRGGEALYLLPDMNFGVEDSVFVPFYGVQAATVPSLSRFAQLGRACVVPVITRLTPQGYDVEVLPAWDHYPTGDTLADTATMNRRLEHMIDTMPSQYYWVHQRFKSRPPGEPAVYR